MAKRISRKLLVGLGSVVTFGAVGTVSGFGVKSIIDSTINHNQANQLAQAFPEADYTKMSNYNVASKDMFIDTTDLSRFHFGNVQKGQTVTPYGWIGIYRTEKTNTFQNIALIGWNGEVLWTYDNTQGRDVYDVKYDYNTDLLFVLKTSSSSGISQNGNTPIELDVLEGKTGRRVDRVTEVEFKTMQTDTYSTLSTVWNLNPTDKVKNLMQIDLISKKNKTNEVLLNWMPNYMQIGDRSDGSLTTLFNFRTTWDNLMKLIKFTKKTDQSGNWTHNIIRPNSGLLFNNFNFAGGNNWQEPAWDLEARFLNNYTFITNPFFTINNDDSYTLHMIVASNGTKQFPQNKDQQENGAAIIHKAVGISSDFQNPKTNINVFQQMGGKFIFKKSPFYSEYNNWPYKLALNNKTNWYKFNTVTPDAVIKANTRINRNMFDNNSIITPYIYSINSKYPIYDVMQLNIDPANGKISFDTNINNKKMTKRWSFGQDIVNYYEKNKAKYGAANAENSNVNRIFPYPDVDNKNLDVNHNYNRLISVSPFDNTFIYAAKPYLRYTQFNPDNTDNNNKYAGFWVASDQIRNNKPQIRPFVIVNDQAILKGAVDPKMTSIDAIYNDGFTFDPTSFYTDSSGKKHLNLYYNQNGTERNAVYTESGMKSSKIGLLKDVVSVANRTDNEYNGEWVWTTSIAEKYFGPYNGGTLGLHTTGITRSDFSTLIHSRADLTKWYNWSWKNLNFAGNLFAANERINDNDASPSRAIAKRFDNKLTDSEFSSGQSVDLVSAWKDKSDNGTLYANDPVNYNRLAIKRPAIKVGTLSSGPNSLPVITRYEMSEEANKIINSKPTWGLKASLGINDYNNSILVLQKVQTINNVSTQIVSSWKEQYRMEKIQRVTDQLNSQTTAWSQLSNPSWQDKITNPNLAFGNANNNLVKNGKQPLRLMLKLVKPAVTLPKWFGKNFDNYFEKAYPVQPINNKETSFAQMVKEYANKKAQLIDLSDPNNAPVGLGNLKIEAYLELNPDYSNSSQIYYNGDSSKRNTKRYLQESSGAVIIYQDLSPDNIHLIYDQSQIQFTDFVKGAFGDTEQSAVRKSIINSWKQGVIKSNFQIKVSTEYSNLQDNLVRKSSTDTGALFSFNYKNGTNNQIEIIPNNNDLNWFKNHFENYNRMIGLFVDFEYQLSGQSTTTWTKLGTTWTDSELKTNFQTNKNKLLIQNAPDNIEKIRFRLKKGNQNDQNLAINMIGFNENENKYISNPVTISIKKINVNKDWILNQTLSNQSNSLINLQTQDITNFETSVLNSITNPIERAAVKLVYSFENSPFNLDAAALVKKIKDKFNNFTDPNQGVFALWNGNNGSQLIKAKFELTDPNGNFKLVVGTNQSPGESDLSNYVKSNIKSKIDIQSYINDLQAKPISAAMVDNQPGKIKPNSIIIPAKSGQPGADRFNGKTFEDINRILKTEGISIKFKKQPANGGSWSNWLDLNQIDTYWTSSPQIQIGFVFDSNQKPANIELVSGTSTIADQASYTLKLNLPKIVKLPANEQSIINAYNNGSFGGNTFNLSFDKTKLDQAQAAVLNALKQASQGNNGNDYSRLDAVLEFKYQLGNSDFLDINQLKEHLKKQSDDQGSNTLKLKVAIKNTPGQDPEFALEQNLANKEFLLQPDNNKVVKKWLHGKTFESELKKNNISVTGSKSNLTYTLNGDLTKFSKNDGKYAEKQLILQYQLLGKNNSVIQGWTDGYLPSQVASNVTKIKVKVVWDKSVTTANQIYIYGPEDNSTPAQAESEIDLSRIATLVKIDPNWFDQVAIVTTKTDTKNITAQIIQKWENEIYKKIPEIADPNIKSKIIIKYEFAHHQGLTATNLISVINSELTKYTNNEHHGIVKLYDKNAANQNGYKIKATFEKLDPNDPTIQFVNNAGTVIDGDVDARTGIVNTTNITTTLDLTQWITNLINKPTIIETQSAGTIPPGGLKPPSLTTNALLGNNAKFNDLKQWLSTANINLLWSKTSDGTSGWKNSDTINEYDPTKKKLWFAIENKASNLVLTLGNGKPSLTTQQDNKTSPFEIKLDAPAVINVKPSQLLPVANHISGDTKNFIVNVNEIKKIIDQIKKSLGPGFENAPLTILLGVGNEGLTDYTKIQKILLNKNDDVENGIVVAQFAIDQNDANASKFQIAKGGEDTQQIIDDNGTIKVYINDQNTFADLQKVVLSGSDKNLQFNWSSTKFNVDNTTGVISSIGATRGVGLKIQYTFENDLEQNSTAVGQDPYTQWVDKQPTNFDPSKATHVNIRMQVTNSNKYIYEKIYKNEQYKFQVDLANISKTIELDGDWLKINPFINNNLNIEQLDVQHFQTYETAVMNKITSLSDQLKQNIKIIYSFNGEQNLTKEDLIKKIKGYGAANASDQNKNFGILKLWNGHSGEKITSTFKDQTVGNINFTWKDPKNKAFDLDFSKVITTIDLIAVIKWLEQIKVSFNQGNTDGTIVSGSLQFNQNIIASGSPFNNKTWDQLEAVLERLNLKVEYQPSYKGVNSTTWFDDKNSINQYDPSTNIFKVRFLVEENKGINLKVKIKNNETIDGVNKRDSNPINVNLKAARKINLDQTIINQFKSKNVATGNTKYLKIDVAAQEKLIKDLLAKNDNDHPGTNPAFSSAKLQVLYYMGDTAPTNDLDWKLELSNKKEFTNSLKDKQTNQTSNKIWFKFRIDPSAGQEEIFKVDTNQTYVLSDKDESINNGNQVKIPYFVHTDQFETKVSKLSIDGTTNQFSWNFSSLGQENTDYVKNNNQIFLKANGAEVLQLHFTTKRNPIYDDSQISDDISEINSKWVTKIPTTIQNQATVYVRVVAKSNNFIYQAAGKYQDENNLPVATTAIAHPVKATIKNVIKVDKQWLNQDLVAPTEIEINQLNETLINNWIGKLKTKIKATNGVDDSLANKINIEFEFNGSKYNSQKLVEAIKLANKNYNDKNSYGIVQLWNEQTQKGTKIKATFVNTDINNIILKDTNDQNDNVNNPFDTTKEELSSDLNTKNIYTLVDLTTYVNVLKNDKTSVVHKNPNNPNDPSITSFNPPSGKNPNGIFDLINYDQVANRLNQIGISIKFNKNDNAGNWVEKSKIDAYIPGKDPKLFMAFYNEQNNNIQLKLDQSLTILQNQNSENQRIGLPLAVPKDVNVSLNDVVGDLTIYNFNGNTRNINFNSDAEQRIFDRILQSNNIAANADKPKFILEFQVGGVDYEYKKLSDLKQYLQQQPANIDFKHTSIEWRISIDPTQVNEWKFSPNSQTQGTLYTNDSSPLQIYINNQNIYEDLQKTIPDGDSDNLVLNWQGGISINPTNGILSANPLRGVGLKIEFTFNESINGNSTNVGSDPYQQWTATQPSKFKDVSKLYLRIKTQSNKYFYDHIDKKITIDLAKIPKKINLKQEWLEKEIVQNDLDIKQLTKTEFEKYEKSVFDAALNDPKNALTAQERSKLVIHYIFDGNTYKTIDQLIKAINDYQTNNNANKNYGILQLWNQTIGEKITTKFALVDNPGDNYQLTPDNLSYDLNLSKVLTTIDFSKIITWLTTTKKLINVTNSSPNAILNIPNVNVTGDRFDQKQWVDVEQSLSKVGITVQYREMLQTNLPNDDNNWFDNLNQVKKYDEKIGKIQLRFKFNNDKAKNIKFQTATNNIHDGKNTNATDPFELSLNIRLTLNIKDDIINNNFVQKTDVIMGNTKYLKIKKEYETQMIIELIKDNSINNNAFNDAQLIVKYRLGNQTEWKQLDQFINDLKTSNNDQTSNQVLFKFEIINSNDFQVDESERILFDPTTEQDKKKWKVKLFINDSNWEKQAQNVLVTGKTSSLKWNWNGLNVTEQTSGKVQARGLQVEFSAKANASYDEPDASDNLADLINGWITIKPTQIDATIKSLYIRIKAKDGYIYGPSYSDDGHSKSAKAHQVNLEIKREILVDPKVLSTSLTIDGKPTAFVTDITKDVLDKFVNDGLNSIQQDLKPHVTVKFKFNGKSNLTSETLFNEINKIINTNNDPNYYGVLQLWNGTKGNKIEAYYDLVNPRGDYELVTKDQSDPSSLQEVTTSHIKTKINLVDIVKDLVTKKIEFESIVNKNIRNIVQIKKWKMPQIKSGSEALNGLSWDAFENRLKAVGVLIKARVVTSPDNPQTAKWESLDQLKNYDDTTLQLALRFEIDNQNGGSNIVLSVVNDGDVNPDQTNSLFSSEFKMNIKAPATVVVDAQFVNDFKNGYKINGNTKKLVLDKDAEDELIKKIADANKATNPTVFDKLESHLSIEYYLGKDINNISDNNWMTRENLISFLESQKNDQPTNQIWFRLNVKNSTDVDAQIFQINQNPQILNPEDISANAKVKIFVNETGFTKAIERLRAVGSTDDFNIIGLDEWKRRIPEGLEIWYSNQVSPNEDDDKNWDQKEFTTLNTDKKLWVRFKVKDGYEFENARQDNAKYSDKKAINTEGIKVIIKLKTEWLEKIIITGNTKDAQLNEDNVMKDIADAGVLPSNEKDLIELQYNIKGTNNWLTKNDFLSELKKLLGSKDSHNFILRRDDLQVRFNIKNSNSDQYGLNINDQNVDDLNRNKFNVQMIDDAKNHNESFRGYINVDKLSDFVIDNFRIIGSTSKPKLIISKRDELNSLFMPYASDNLFDIELSTIQKADGQWDWTKNQSILVNGQLINQDGLINQNIQIGADKKFAIRLIAKDNKYDVYKNDNKKDDGYLLDLSSKVSITIEITNPFSLSDKTLGIWTRDAGTGKYYQGQGGFKIVVANKKTLEVESNGTQSAQQFLNDSQLQNNEKEALEFVYHIFGSNPTEDEIKKVKESINDYNDESTWISFNKSKNNDDWSGDLGLRVGDYVAVAIRVKKEYATQKDPFILKDDDHSMILPVMKDDSNILKKPGRIAGYKVKTDEIKVERNSVVVSNMVSFELPPLDGWSELQKLNLEQDKLGNYLGVDLKFQVYSNFHEDKSGRILKSGSGLKLIERNTDKEDPNVTTTGTYKDGNNQDIIDKNNQTVKIWKNKNTKRLSVPKKSSTPTKEISLNSAGNGSFRLLPILDKDERERFSLFRNQDVSLKLEANKGEGTEALPDFYLDKQDKILDIKNEVSPQIKFIVENEDKITYGWNYEEFLPDKIKYKAPGNSADKRPEDGNAQIETIYKLIKKTPDQESKIITGTTIEQAMLNIQKQLEDDFDGQLKFQTTYINKKGNQIQEDGNNIYKYQSLNNKDRIMLKIVAVDDDLFYVTNERPLIINVNGLTEAAPTQDKLQHLRVKQGGKINGQGSFKVLVSNPNDDDEDDRSILKGWKFMVRVWSKDLDETTGKHKIKINWTDDQASIKNLANGDKVEWKLVSEDGNPVKEAYYNTIALEHQSNDDDSIKYNFAQIQYQNGDSTYTKVKDGIGDYPENDEYPENSGFIISGLKSAIETFKISKENFAKVLAQLQPTYVGINTQGTIHFDPKYFDENYWVNTNGELYVKKDQVAFKDQSINEIGEIPLTEFLDHVTFYTHDPVIANYQGGFKFSGNDININNHLTNGDQMWATFDTINTGDNSGLNNNDPTTSVVTQLLDVSGLKDIIDPMSPLWYVLMALAGIATLGTAALIAFLIARHKKLKGKN